MADQQQDEDLVLSFFPDPPPYFRHFTADNLDRLRQIEKEASGDNDTKDGDSAATSGPTTSLSIEQILALPAELRYLIPPEPPADDEEFKVFGEATKAKGTEVFQRNLEFIGHRMKEEHVLEDWTYEQLYPSSQPADSSAPSTVDRQTYLFRFLRSILLSYLSFLGIVALKPVDPAKDEKLADILTMITNMHALINEYRPHQARETLIMKMEEQVERKKREIEGVKKVGERVKSVLEGFNKDAGTISSDAEEGPSQGEDEHMQKEKDRKEAQRQMWQTMDEILG